MAINPETKSAAKPREGRSPAYPSLPVQKALEKAEALFLREKSNPAPLVSALEAWGYGPKSSGGRQTLATMKYYGLIEVTGEGDARLIRVSEVARRIILDKREDGSEKRALIRQVALTPTAHRAIYQRYSSELPSDGTVHHFLVFERNFNDDAARELISEYKQTAAFVGLYEAEGFESAPNDQIPCDEGDTLISPTSDVRPAAPQEMSTPEMQPAQLGTRNLSGQPDFIVQLGSGRIAYIEIKGGPPTPRALGKLERFIRLQKELLEDEDEDIEE